MELESGLNLVVHCTTLDVCTAMHYNEPQFHVMHRHSYRMITALRYIALRIVLFRYIFHFQKRSCPSLRISEDENKEKRVQMSYSETSQ